MKLFIQSDAHYDFYVPPKMPKNYFKKYFLPADVLVCAGHTHTACREGNLFVNPLGYPDELPLKFNSLKREDFLLEM